MICGDYGGITPFFLNVRHQIKASDELGALAALLPEQEPTGEEADSVRTRWRREKSLLKLRIKLWTAPANHNVQRPTKNQALLVRSLIQNEPVVDLLMARFTTLSVNHTIQDGITAATVKNKFGRAGNEMFVA
jgi:hypothetical protein